MKQIAYKLLPILILLISSASLSYAQDFEAPKKDKTEDQDKDKVIIPYDEKDDIVEARVFTEAEKAAVCKKHNGQYVTYAANVYLIEKCKWREIQNSDLIFDINKKKFKITPVEAEVIATLDPGEPLQDMSLHRIKKRSCKEFNNKYVTYSHTEVFYVSNCEKHAFPDWETYVEHRKKIKATKSLIEAVTYEEFRELKSGAEFPSYITSEFGKILSGQKGIEVIPIDEACKNVDNKIVSFVSRLYKIEKCHKREYDAEYFTMQNKGKKFKLVEITSEQWLSLPDGAPMPTATQSPEPPTKKSSKRSGN